MFKEARHKICLMEAWYVPHFLLATPVSLPHTLPYNYEAPEAISLGIKTHKALQTLKKAYS